MMTSVLPGVTGEASRRSPEPHDFWMIVAIS
jgi:hypothetical protein